MLVFSISETSRNVLKSIAAISLVFLGIGVLVILFLFEGRSLYSYCAGIIFGAVFTCLKFMLLERTLNRSANMPSKNAQNYVRLHYMFRYFLTGVALVVCALRSPICLLGFVLGLFSLRPAVYLAAKKVKDEIV